jgi:hypothetical protein
MRVLLCMSESLKRTCRTRVAFDGWAHHPYNRYFHPSFRHPERDSITHGDLGTRDGLLGGINAVIVGNYLTTLGRDPDEDLEPGYCDPVQIVGDDSRKGFIFLEWSKDETPRFFRYAIRPLSHLWNPDNVGWEEIPAEKRPMVQIERAPFSRDEWTHAVFTLENINDKSKPQAGRLYLNGKLQGTIENRDLTLGWDPDRVRLVLGAAYVGHMDDLAVFDRALTDGEVRYIYGLEKGVRELR